MSNFTANNYFCRNVCKNNYSKSNLKKWVFWIFQRNGLFYNKNMSNKNCRWYIHLKITFFSSRQSFLEKNNSNNSYQFVTGNSDNQRNWISPVYIYIELKKNYYTSRVTHPLQNEQLIKIVCYNQHRYRVKGANLRNSIFRNCQKRCNMKCAC